MNASSRSPPSLNDKKSGKDDDDLDEDDSEDEIVVQHRSKSALMRRKVLVLDDSEDDVTDSDIEFTTEDVKEEDDTDGFVFVEQPAKYTSHVQAAKRRQEQLLLDILHHNVGLGIEFIRS